MSACTSAGLPVYKKKMSQGWPAPLDMEETNAVATDDIKLFKRCLRSDGKQRIEMLVAALFDHGIRKHANKDLTQVLNGTAIGIDLVDGQFCAPHAPKLAKLLRGRLALLKNPDQSLLQLSAFIGHPTWFSMLNRPLLSRFHHVFYFTKRENGSVPQALPRKVVAELCLML